MTGENKQIAKWIAEYIRVNDPWKMDCDPSDTAAGIIDTYEQTLAQISGDGWTHVAWYLITQLAPARDDIQGMEAYEILEHLFALHGIG